MVLYFMSIIKEPKYQGYVHVCVEYCKLLKNILSVQVYQHDITVKTWQGIVKYASHTGSLLGINQILIHATTRLQHVWCGFFVSKFL